MQLEQLTARLSPFFFPSLMTSLKSALIDFWHIFQPAPELILLRSMVILKVDEIDFADALTAARRDLSMIYSFR